MSPADEATRFLAQSAEGGGLPPDEHPGPSGSNVPEASSAQGDASDAIVGRRIGAYLITKHIGSGGVGEVFKGVDVMLQREVAIKVLRDELASDPIFLKRFSNEAQFLAKLSHANVASVHAFFNEGGKQFMVMEYVAGISLDEFIRSGGPVPVERALNIFRKALEGIGHAHGHGIVHRDIKPANIMLADSGQVKVMDFGIARALDSQEQLTRHGQVAGTAKAMAPEQIRGAQADVRSDIYSLGIVLYTLLAGRPPFVGQGDHALMLAQLEQVPPPLRSWVANVPPKLEAAVMRALEKDPAGRFQSVAAFAQAIDACLADVAKAGPPAVDSFGAQTSSRTVINPVLQGAQRLPSSGVDGGQGVPQEDAHDHVLEHEHPHAHPRAHERAAGPRRKWPWLPAGAAALGVVALGLGGLLWPTDPKPTVSNPAAENPVAQNPVAQNPTVPDPNVPPEAAANPVAPAPIVSPPPAIAVKPPTLAIVRLASDGTVLPAAAHRFNPGERIRLQITPSQDVHVYCYLQNEAGRIVRFYPNRFNTNALVRADAPLQIPGAMRFELFANNLRVPETIACFASERDVAGALPASVVGDDLTELPVASLDEVRQVFVRVAADGLAEGRFQIGFK